MAKILASPTLRRTKLYRPQVVVDSVKRERLSARMREGVGLPLTLVCAPAGYGKSTLLSDFTEYADRPGAWLSLDQDDNDLGLFLAYLIAAVRTCFPASCDATLAALESSVLPKPSILTACLSNDLESTEQPFILVLDDYHCIHLEAIHEVIDRLLVHPVPTMHLIVATRRDPPLALGTLRACGKMSEIGVRELAFSDAHVIDFLKSAADIELSERGLALLQDRIEGWPAGLRLAVLALRSRADPEAFIQSLREGALKAEDYLAREVIGAQPPTVRDWLRKTSILDRFCGPLCEAVCSEPNEDSARPGAGRDFLKLIESAGLFGICLDDTKDWYRYHHLFQRLLQSQLAESATQGGIAALHQRAGRWFDRHGLIEEAISHYLRSPRPALAAGMIVRWRQTLTDGEQWSRVERCLARLAEHRLTDDLDLLILRAKLLDKQGRYAEWSKLLDRIHGLLDDRDLDDPANRRRQGEIATMRGALDYHEGRGPEAFYQANRALDLLPDECGGERVYAQMVLAATLQMRGKLSDARGLLNVALEGTVHSNPTVRGRLLQALAFIEWIAGDLSALEQAAASMSHIARTHRLPETAAYAHFFSGAVHYHSAHMDAAEAAVLPVATDRYGVSFLMHLMCVQCLALIRVNQGRGREATQLSVELMEFMLESGKTSLVSQAQALQAILDLRLGRDAEAFRWAWAWEFPETPAGYHFLSPELVAVRVLVEEGSEASMARASDSLQVLSKYFRSVCNDRLSIEVLALQAMCQEHRGQRQAATAILGQAISLAQAGGFIQLFVDLGTILVPVLSQLVLDEPGARFVGSILARFRHQSAATASLHTSGDSHRSGDTMAHALTRREVEVLELLARRMSNSEIADTLFISPKTVRRHTENIYSKIGVHGRREAVARALGLGILG